MKGGRASVITILLVDQGLGRQGASTGLRRMRGFEEDLRHGDGDNSQP